MTILRGTARVLAAVTGLLLVYGVGYALEGITTRIPTAAARELALAILWTAPWMLLFCSGVEDLSTAAHKDLVLWFGAISALAFLYYFDWHTSDSLLTKAAMPLLAVSVGLVPHFVKRLRFLFALSSIAAGVAGGYVLYFVAAAFLPSSPRFNNKVIPILIVTFGSASIIAGLLAVLDLCRNLTRRLYGRRSQA